MSEDSLAKIISRFGTVMGKATVLIERSFLLVLMGTMTGVGLVIKV